MRKVYGLTLVELLVVVAISAIIVSIAIPSYLSLTRNNRLIGTTQQLYYALQLAKSEAVKRNATVFISYRTGTNWCYGANTGSACNCSTASNCNLGASAASNTQLTLSATGSGSNFSFNGMRGATYSARNLTFTLTSDSTTSMTVRVGSQGSLRVCSGSLTGYGSCS